MNKNNFQLALESLGFNTPQEQEALWQILSIAGYFDKRQVWQDLLHLDPQHAQELLQTIYPTFVLAGVQSQCNPSLLNVQFCENYLLYVSQHAFGRNAGAERYEIKTHEWAEQNKETYLHYAGVLGLTNSISPPKGIKFAEVWIAGGARERLILRLAYYKNLPSELQSEYTVVLAGTRPAWADIDGISPNKLKVLESLYQGKADQEKAITSLPVGEESSPQEGKVYLLEVAEKNTIKLNQEQPFIHYATQQECPKGLLPNREYPNYAHDEQKRITETVIAEDLIARYLPDAKIIVSDVAASEGHRPTTATTAYCAAKDLLKIVNKDEKTLNVLLISNNPYIERQKISAQEQANKASTEFNEQNNANIQIIVDAAGYCANQDVPTIHSELAALVAVRWQKAHPGEKADHLLYQTRNHDYINIEPLDLSGEVSSHLLPSADIW